MRTLALAAFLILVAMAYGQEGNNEQSPPEHKCQMMEHGEMAMGFSQMKSTHHFRLTESGGIIEVQANDTSDTVSRDQIRQHLQAISKAFAQGDFSSPLMTHGKLPTGASDMRRLKGSLSYKYVETDRGGEVIITAAGAEPLQAVYQFLRFQIEEHETGDPESVQKQ